MLEILFCVVLLKQNNLCFKKRLEDHAQKLSYSILHEWDLYIHVQIKPCALVLSTFNSLTPEMSATTITHALTSRNSLTVNAINVIS